MGQKGHLLLLRKWILQQPQDVSQWQEAAFPYWANTETKSLVSAILKQQQQIPEEKKSTVCLLFKDRSNIAVPTAYRHPGAGFGDDNVVAKSLTQVNSPKYFPKGLL